MVQQCHIFPVCVLWRSATDLCICRLFLSPLSRGSGLVMELRIQIINQTLCIGFSKFFHSVWVVQTFSSFTLVPVEGQLELFKQVYKGYFCKEVINFSHQIFLQVVFVFGQPYLNHLSVHIWKNACNSQCFVDICQYIELCRSTCCNL